MLHDDDDDLSTMCLMNRESTEHGEPIHLGWSALLYVKTSLLRAPSPVQYPQLRQQTLPRAVNDRKYFFTAH